MTEPIDRPARPRRRTQRVIVDAHAVRDREKTAGIVSRGAAALLDLMAVLAILGGIYVSLLLARLLYNVHHFSAPDVSGLFTFTVFMAVSVAYLASCWAVSGRSLGCVVMGLRVVTRKGNRLRPSVALVRALICTFFAIGLLWVVVDRKRRSVADIFLFTRVVYSR